MEKKEITNENKQGENTPKINSSDVSSKKDFFSQNNPSNIFLNKAEEKTTEVNSLIDEIRKSSPISIWDLGEKLKGIMSPSKLYYLIRDLEFAGVVFTKVKLNKNNRSSRMIYISKERKK